MSRSYTGCLISKVHIWDIMFARVEYLQSFSKSGMAMTKHLDWTYFRAFKSSVKSVN